MSDSINPFTNFCGFSYFSQIPLVLFKESLGLENFSLRGLLIGRVIGMRGRTACKEKGIIHWIIVQR